MVVTTRVEGFRLWIGERFSISFQRTLRIPDDGRSYPLPPGLGGMPVQSVEPHADRLPAGWRDEGGYFVPMYQREALWLGFGGAEWKPNAVQIMAGRINAISGQPWSEGLQATPQNYVVCPEQPWLDGINAGEGFIRQFVAMPLGLNYTVEGQITGSETFGGIQIIVYEPKPGIFPDEPPPPKPSLDPLMSPLGFGAPPVEMGLAAGGKIKQKIYPDPYGIDTWDQGSRETVFVHLVNSQQYRAITNEEPPPTPIDAKTYTEHGLPWFDLYDESKGDVSASEKLANVKSVTERDAEINRSPTERDQTPIDVPESQITKLKHETEPKRR